MLFSRPTVQMACCWLRTRFRVPTKSEERRRCSRWRRLWAIRGRQSAACIPVARRDRSARIARTTANPGRTSCIYCATRSSRRRRSRIASSARPRETLACSDSSPLQTKSGGRLPVHRVRVRDAWRRRLDCPVVPADVRGRRPDSRAACICGRSSNVLAGCRSRADPQWSAAQA
jgi:hypothetical protein